MKCQLVGMASGPCLTRSVANAKIRIQHFNSELGCALVSGGVPWLLLGLPLDHQHRHRQGHRQARGILWHLMTMTRPWPLRRACLIIPKKLERNLVIGKSIPVIARAAQWVKFLWIDDAWVTGFIAQHLQIKHQVGSDRYNYYTFNVYVWKSYSFKSMIYLKFKGL